MKRTRKHLAVLLWVVTAIVLLPMLAFAATGTQDGLVANLTTNKTTYNVGDAVAVTATVTNSNPVAVSNVRVDVTLPNDLKLASGSTSVTLGTLAAGETRTAGLTATVREPSSDIPKTGDDFPFTILFGLLIASMGSLLVLAIYKKKSGYKMFSLLLCLLLALSTMGSPALTAITTRNFSLQETVQLAGTNGTITVKVTYDWDDGAGSVAPVITSANNTSVTSSTGGTFQVTATGTTPITYSLDGSEPAGVSINASTGLITIAGTTAVGSYTFSIMASNGTLPNATQSFTLTVNATPLTNITFTAAQTGGTSNTADSTGIVLAFSQTVTGLTAGDITITSGTGAAVKGTLSGSGTVWTIGLADVTTEGSVNVSVADFGTFHVTNNPQPVTVYQGSRYTLTVNIVTVCGSGAGSVSTQQTSYRPGASATVNATANSPYAFLKWVTSDDLTAVAVSTNANYTFNLTANTTLYAVFSVDSTSFQTTTGITIASGVVTNGSGATGAVVIPSVVDGVAVTSVANEAFLNNTNITSITLPDTVQSFGVRAFQNCSNLASVTLPSTLQSIANQMFQGCTSLTSITLPDGLQSIGTQAFYNTGLTSITLPAALTTLGQGALGNISSLTTVTFLGNKPTIDNLAFWRSDNLVDIYYLSTATGWVGNEEFPIVGATTVPVQAY